MTFQKKKKIVCDNANQSVSNAAGDIIEELRDEVIPEKQDTKQITHSENLSQNAKERLESDQEKMVLELFDGKYIE